MAKISVAAINIFPIKSCGGIDVSTCEVVESGIVNDHLYMAIDDATRRFLSQRDHPELARVKTLIENNILIAEHPDLGRLKLNLRFNDPADYGHIVDAQIHNDPCRGFVAGKDEAVFFFSEVTGIPARLLRHSLTHPRIHCSSTLGHAVPSKFTDGYPILIASTASLELLKGKMREAGTEDPAAPLTMASFRPQFVFEGCDPHEEDAWNEIEVGEVRLRFVKKCVRCVIPQINQETGRARRKGEPTRTLRTYRRVPGSKKDITFASNYIVLQGGMVNVGDPVQILS